MVQSIVMATVNEVPDELKEQADDFQEIIDMCVKYSHKHGVGLRHICSDLSTVLES